MDVVFLWHMHQPDYRDRAHRKILLPWARLHALKDYYDMPARLLKYEGIHQTFNLVPSLVDQVESYLSGSWSEEELDLFIKRADELSDEEKHSILRTFFLSPEDWMIRPYPRYSTLLRDWRLRNASDLMHRWSPQEWRDLQFWRQLAWFDPLIREQDPFIEDLVRQGQNYDEFQKEMLLERMKHWLGESMSIYRRLQDQGVIEVSVSPYYHPILPLLADPSSVKEGLPDCPLPNPSASHPEDARAQVEKAITFYEDRFGRRPQGMWPSEGSVSQAVAEILREAGLHWFATDEDILARSLGRNTRSKGGDSRLLAEDLYQPYKTLAGEGPAVLFRDHRLSDLIGFEYAHWDADKAAAHLARELLSIRDHWTGHGHPLVSIILDGENCWEYFERDGGPFLDAFYQTLQKHPEIRCCTVSEALKGRRPRPLERLSAGSWINGNFFIWMGEEADRRAWELLEQARTALVGAESSGRLSGEKAEEAWEEIYIAEGSDWFWWYGDSQQSKQDSLFDEMFRLHLLRVYELAGLPTPNSHLTPVESPSLERFRRTDPYLPAPPVIDGRETHYYEWRAAECFEPGRHGGAMQQVVKSRISSLHYGVDDNRFYLRVNPTHPHRPSKSDWRWELLVTGPKALRLRFIPSAEGFRIQKQLVTDAGREAASGEEDGWEEVGRHQAVAAEQSAFEASLSWELLESKEGETLSFFIGFPSGKDEIELIPPLSSLCVVTPGKDRPGRHWFP
jgi:alpha-amylase/alpha-mannosidase (GH57 family)